MKNKFQLTAIALMLGGIALSGCAPKQAWSPELADARAAYEKAAGNPLVNSLAIAELDQAKRQLKSADDAADFFKGREEIAHEATLAHLKSLEAEQTARALQAKRNLKLAQAGHPIPQALPATLPNSDNAMSKPVIAAATPAGSEHHTGSVSGGSATEVQKIAMQLAALSQQIAQLQTVTGSVQTSHDQTIVSASQTDLLSLQPYNDEPAIGAAKPAQESNTLQPVKVPTVDYNAQLREELRAMNARPRSNGMALVLGERYFKSGSASLWNGRAARHLDNIAAVMAETPGLIVDVEAHTDNQDTQEARDNLTSDRATAIKSALVLRGIDGGRINTTGFGDSAPIADNNTELGRLQNRRVEIVFPNIEGF